MQIELFYTRYQPNMGNMLQSDTIAEFPAGLAPSHWSVEEHAHADRATRLFRAWNCVKTDDHDRWVAFAAIVDGKRIIIGVEAVRELLVAEGK